MNSIFLEATSTTPRINLNSLTGSLEIAGKSIPEDAEEFYSPILDWFDNYLQKPAKSSNLVLDLEFFNISSSKRILFILYKMNELKNNGLDVNITWYFNEEDEDMLEVGEDYSFMVNVPFKFIEKEPFLI